MRRAGHLIEAIAGADNLRRAFFKACRGKRGQAEVLRFRGHLDSELARLQEELLSGSFVWGPYHTFKIYDHKERTICAAPFRARVAQHAVMNICETVFEDYQIHDSYAYRPGKGLDAALARAHGFVCAGGWYLKLDIRKYFDSVDHAVLLDLLARKFKDKALMRLFDRLIEGYVTTFAKGIPIGNLTSQYFANHYLAIMDHFVKEDLRFRRYVRYMDDFVLWSETKAELLDARDMIATFLKERLLLELKPVCLDTSARGMTFLGYRVFPERIGLARRSRDRFRRTAVRYTRLYDAGLWDETQLARHMEPLLSFVRRSSSRGYRLSVLEVCGPGPEARTA